MRIEKRNCDSNNIKKNKNDNNRNDVFSASGQLSLRKSKNEKMGNNKQ